MDQNLAVHAQDLDNENGADQAMEDCLRNPLIIRKILERFSSKELLQISLVNKLWKYEARSVVSQRGNLIANLRPKKGRGDGCDAVAAFVSDLSRWGATPFSGIKFDINYWHDGHRVCAFASEDPLGINDVNLRDQLSLKDVSVTIEGPWPYFRCPAFLLAKKVLQQFCEDLEELELRISVNYGDYIQEVLQACYFPRMKILKVSWDTDVEGHNLEDIEGYMRALLSRAPNLKFLHTDWNINSALQLLEGTSVGIVYAPAVRAPFDVIPENALSAITLERWNLEYTGRGFNFERFHRIAPVLLQASRTSKIRYINVDAVLAVPLMCYGARMENVKMLRMDISRMESIEPRILNIVKNFDFTRIFPNLDKVHVVSDNHYHHGFPPEHINPLMGRATACLTEPLLDRAERIKKMFIARWPPSSAAAQFFLEMFPNIQKLEIQIGVGACRPIHFGSIWNWLDLTELEVKGNMLRIPRNLDSVFCGIFPEEVEELRLKDDEYLKQVNIVPPMPAVTCLRNLKTISLIHWHYSNEPFANDDATFIFSKVTALVAFARQPGLAVNLKICGRTTLSAMTHLKPYVSVTFNNLWG